MLATYVLGNEELKNIVSNDFQKIVKLVLVQEFSQI